jgi:hypothetical protein
MAVTEARIKLCAMAFPVSDQWPLVSIMFCALLAI